MQMLPLAEDLARAGHRVFAALRHVSAAAEPFGRAGVAVLQAPFKSTPPTYVPRPAGFAELEQFPGRGPVPYWGPVSGAADGKVPDWPQGPGKKVFAYLKPFPALPALLEALRDRGCPTVAYIDGLDSATRSRFECPTLCFERQRLDMRRVARECDLAILNAGQGATAALLLAGKPILQIPTVPERRLTAEATARLRAGKIASPAMQSPCGEVWRHC